MTYITDHPRPLSLLTRLAEGHPDNTAAWAALDAQTTVTQPVLSRRAVPVLRLRDRARSVTGSTDMTAALKELTGVHPLTGWGEPGQRTGRDRYRASFLYLDRRTKSTRTLREELAHATQELAAYPHAPRAQRAYALARKRLTDRLSAGSRAAAARRAQQAAPEATEVAGSRTLTAEGTDSTAALPDTVPPQVPPLLRRRDHLVEQPTPVLLTTTLTRAPGAPFAGVLV